MSTLAKFMIVVGADNHPPMLDKPQYESWKSQIELYIQVKDHGRIILNSVENGLLVWPTFPQIDSVLNVLTLLPGDDSIACMNKAMAFLSAVFLPRYPPTNNQLKSSSNPRNQATIQYGRVTVQQVQGRQGAKGKELDDEQLEFLADPGVADSQVAQTITHNAAFQTDDLDAYDSDYDDISSAKAVLMTNLSSCDSYVLSEANNESKIINESLTAELERYKEQVKILKQRFNVDLSSREKFIDSQTDDMIRMKNTKFAAFETEIDRLKQALSKHVKEKESLLTTLNAMHMLTKPQVFYDNTYKQLLGYQNPFYLKRAQRIKPILYDGNVLSKTHEVLSVVDDEETLILAKESQLKMVEKNDPIMKKEKINITPINYSELNKFAKDFGKRFVPQQELPAEQKFWLQSSDKNSKGPSTSNTPVKIEVPS
ncbi:hypothetical protein Tco_0526810 [Tanacetum coccineum]